jgi:hypothetical protein
VEAPAQGDEGGRPEEVENPGEHRAPDGLNTRLGATNFRGEKGPEDEPISQCTACLRSIRARTSVRRTGERREPGLKTRRQLRLVARVKDERWMWNLVSAPSSTSPTQTVPSRGRPWHKSRADAPRGGPASAGTPKEAADAGFSLRPMRGLVPGSGFGRPREFYEAGAGRRNRPRRAGRRHPSGYHRPSTTTVGVENRRFVVLVAGGASAPPTRAKGASAPGAGEGAPRAVAPGSTGSAARRGELRPARA